eukprot:CAMPEP_0170513412 /NCGR_PEP_ID=MMETSP0208-20121228/67388_1 /TAXON_ID=197538 /ORGANISM="Strombidium inclinatum, Strain S3" /LENGTH=54 /DNA_ID=CAMNT_0010797141 /DNA_START=787 /DNA_END=951 /DNA_ORIENTATION=+
MEPREANFCRWEKSEPSSSDEVEDEDEELELLEDSFSSRRSADCAIEEAGADAY